MKDYCPTCGAPLATAAAVPRVKRWALRKVDEAGIDGITPRDLSVKCASRDRVHLRLATTEAINEGLLQLIDGRRLRTTS